MRTMAVGAPATAAQSLHPAISAASAAVQRSLPALTGMLTWLIVSVLLPLLRWVVPPGTLAVCAQERSCSCFCL